MYAYIMYEIIAILYRVIQNKSNEMNGDCLPFCPFHFESPCIIFENVLIIFPNKLQWFKKGVVKIIIQIRLHVTLNVKFILGNKKALILCQNMAAKICHSDRNYYERLSVFVKIEYEEEFREISQLSAIFTCLYQLIFGAKYLQAWRQFGAESHVCVCVYMWMYAVLLYIQ